MDEDEDEGGKDDDKADKQTLPALKNGEAVACESASVDSKKTTPPQRFTEGTLIQAMANIHQWVEDPEQKKRLKETAGIGTEATRANILETLKKRNFLVEKGKQIISTDPARKLILVLPEAVKSPGMTALFEQLLDGVAEGRVTPEQFMSKQNEFVAKYVEVAKTAEMGLTAAHPCPICKQGHLRKRTSEKGPFWGCSRYQEGCKTSFPDKGGKPDLAAKKPAGKPGAGGGFKVNLAIPGSKPKKKG